MWPYDEKCWTGSPNGPTTNGNRHGRSHANRRRSGALFGFMATASTVLLAGFLVSVGFLAMAMTTHAGTGDPHEGTGGGTPIPVLPGSLDAFYPPAADRPVFLFRMLELETSFSGIVVDLMEDDLDGAKRSFEDFRRQYREAAGMVPEWTEGYPEEAVRALGRALAGGDKGLAMGAFASVGEACHRCHAAAMVPVQQKYHWGDFGSLLIQDPLQGSPTGYGPFKKLLAANLAGVTVDLRQKQTDNARRQFEEFRARFAELRESCRGCHEKESRYFVDREMQETVEELGKVFRGPAVVADAAAELVQKIGRESCSKCHRVHVPAALAGSRR